MNRMAEGSPVPRLESNTSSYIQNDNDNNYLNNTGAKVLGGWENLSLIHILAPILIKKFEAKYVGIGITILFFLDSLGLFFFENNVAAVSYTHLDVYKRQLQHLGVDYLDYYWLHSLDKRTYRLSEELHAFRFVQRCV